MIYLDNNTTTQPTAEVVEAMQPYLTDCNFNRPPSSASWPGVHDPDGAALAMMSLSGAEGANCFTFTSGATESNNWVFSETTRGRKPGRIIISAIEHASVSEPAAKLARAGFEVVEIPVNDQGLILLGALRAALYSKPILVSIMTANNETGVVQPIERIGLLVRMISPTTYFHTDATQSIGKLNVNLQSDWEDVDLLSFSAHKFHGPKGIGGLYIRQGIELEAMLLGGEQQRGLSSATMNTPALAGLASAAMEAHYPEIDEITNLRDSFEVNLLKEFPNAIIHSKSAPRLPNTSFFSLPGADAGRIAERLADSGIIVGIGAMCSSGAIRESKTLRAMGVPHHIARSSLQISLSRFSSSTQLDTLLDFLKSKCWERDEL